MLEHSEFNSELTNQEPAPSDATYNFGSSAATSLGVKVTTYVASALALGGSLFVSNQLLTPPNLKSADQANAAGQPKGLNGNSANSPVSFGGKNGDDTSNSGVAGDDGFSVAAGATSTFGSSSTGNGRLATTPADPAATNGFNTPTQSAPAPTSADPTTVPTVDPAPAPSTKPVVVVPPPTFSHSNTSSATPGASTGSSGNGSSSSGSNYGGENENEGDDH